MRNRFSQLLLLIVVASCSDVPDPNPAGANMETLAGKVVGVTDGDTITVLSDQQSYKIRLVGIDAPERSQAYGAKSKQALSEKIFGKDVRVLWHERDRYGRVLGLVYHDDRSISQQLVEEGWAWHYVQYSDDKELAEAERLARIEKRGLWADAAPVAPWAFRRSPSSVSKARAPPTATEDVGQGLAVYVTRTGTKYHVVGCRYLRKSSIRMSLSAAKVRYGPCSVCDPPK